MLANLPTFNLIPLLTALKGAPLSVLTVLLHASAPVSRADLVTITGYHRQSVARAIAALQARRLIAPRANGWVLIAPIPTPSVENFTIPPQTLKVVKEVEDLRTPQNKNLLLTDSSLDRGNSITPPTDPVPVPLQEIAPASPGGDPAPSVPAMLKHSAGLLGFPVLGSPNEYPDPWLLCAWIACAFHRRKYIRNPAALVHWGAHQNRLPDDSRYLDRPEDFLPPWFLKLIEFPFLEQAEHYDAAYDAPPEALALDQPISGGLTPRQAWQSALERIQPEVAPHEFNTWLKYAILKGFNGHAFEVKASNEYHSDRLDDYNHRLAALLTEIIGRPITVSVWV